MVERLWLDVPYAAKDLAKSSGARWDVEARRWYAPRGELLADLAQWAPSIPESLPGEDRTFGQGLFVDLVPSTCWFTNVRSCVDPGQWDALRSMVYRRAGQRCEICGAPRGQDRDCLEAHERWEYDERSSAQTLRRLVALCWSCHRTTHYGFAEVSGTADEAMAHLRAINQWTRAEARAHIEAAYELWARRSAHPWHLDLSILTDAGIRVREPDTSKTLKTESDPADDSPSSTARRPSLWSRVRRLVHGR
jgi:uncharacterized protein DUF5710